MTLSKRVWCATGTAFRQLYPYPLNPPPIYRRLTRTRALPYDMYESPLMPLPIPVWRDALKVVKRDEAPASNHTRYLFPEAALFASTNKAHHAKFFATWNVF
jgi:hypothetical protein